MVNSCLGPFTAASSRWHPFSRSYGVILPSSLERVISRPWVFSTHPPVSVSGTGDNFHRLRAFLGTTLHHAGSVDPSQSSQGVASSRASLLSSSCQSGNINPVSIDYACRPRLRSRLTPRGRTFRGNPWVFGALDSHQCLRYSSQHSHFRLVHGCSRYRFTLVRNAPLPFTSTTSAHRLVPFIFGARALDQSAVTHCLKGGCF